VIVCPKSNFPRPLCAFVRARSSRSYGAPDISIPKSHSAGVFGIGRHCAEHFAIKIQQPSGFLLVVMPLLGIGRDWMRTLIPTLRRPTTSGRTVENLERCLQPRWPQLLRRVYLQAERPGRVRRVHGSRNISGTWINVAASSFGSSTSLLSAFAASRAVEMTVQDSRMRA
jgi:hypothetical protein